MEANSDLRAHLAAGGGEVVVDSTGRILEEVDVSGLSGPTLLVTPITEALKKVSDEDVVEGFVDRSTAWEVTAYYLDAETVEALDVDGLEIDELYEEVVRLGRTWETHPREDVMEPQGD